MSTMPVRVGVSFDGFVTTGEAVALAQRAVEAGAQACGWRSISAIAKQSPRAWPSPSRRRGPCWSRPRSAPICGTRPRPRWRWRRSTRSRPGARRSPSAPAIPCSLRNPGARSRNRCAPCGSSPRRLRQLVDRRGRARRRRIRAARRRAIGVQAERADPDLYRRHRTGYAAARGPHRRRRGAFGGIVDRIRCGNRSRSAPKAPPGTRRNFGAVPPRRLSVLRRLARSQGGRRRSAAEARLRHAQQVSRRQYPRLPASR